MFYESPKKPVLSRTYHLYAEKIKRFTQKYNLEFSAVTLQAFGSELINGCTGLGWRHVTAHDLRYQVYASLLYYPDKLGWFHYWASKHNVKRYHEKNIMSEFGEKIFYDDVKALNAEIKALTTVMTHFDFNGVNVFHNRKRIPYYYLNDIDFVFRDMKVEKVKGEAVISEGIDKENDRAGYLIHNSIDPLKKKSTKLILSFGNAKEVIIYKKGAPEKATLKNGKLTLKLASADGVYIIPIK